MPQLFRNSAKSTLQAQITDVDLSLTLSGNGAAFPVATQGTGSSGDWFKAVLDDGTNQEVIFVRTHTSGSTSFSNILREREGTQARTWPAGTTIGLRLTAEDFSRVHTPLERVGRVASGWIHVKSSSVVGGVNTYVVEVGAGTTVDLTDGLSSATGTTAYGPARVAVTAGEFTLTGEASQPTGTAALGVRVDTGALVYVGSTVVNTNRLCLIAYQAANTVNNLRSILPSNHFFSVDGGRQNPDTTQTTFHVTNYGASTFDDATDNSPALFYAKWAAQVVNRSRKKLTISDSDVTPPEIDIVFPNGTFVADFSTTKYPPSQNDGPYAYGYWSDFRGMRLVGVGIDKTIIKHSDGEFLSGIFHADSLTLHRVRPGTSSSTSSAQDEVRFRKVKFYFTDADIIGTYLTNYSKANKVYFQECVFDYSSKIYIGVFITNYDVAVVEDCVFNPSKLGFATHQVCVQTPNSRFSRYYNRRNRYYKGTTGTFTRLLDSFKPMVGTIIEDNYYEAITEESVAIDGIGDSTSAPVIGNGLITAVSQPAICPGEYQWLRWRTIGPNNASAWSTPVCLSANTTGTAYTFKASSTQPTTPTGAALVPSGWTATIDLGDTRIWMSTATITNGQTGTWSAPVCINEVRCFRAGTTVSTPSGYIGIDPGWSLAAPALPFTNVWMSKAVSSNGMMRGPTLDGSPQSWSTPVKIDTTPEEATWIEYRSGTSLSSTVQPSEDGDGYDYWRDSPWKHNLVVGADLRRLSNNAVPISSRSDWTDFFFAFEDDSGREGMLCPILYADPVSNTFTLELEAPAETINVGGWAAVHTGAFDCIIRNNRIHQGFTAISAFMNCFGFLIENNKTVNCNQALSLVGMLAQGFLRCRAHNNIVRGNTFIGMREEEYSTIDTGRFAVKIENTYANNPDHRSFNNQFIGNTVIGGRILLAYQGNLTYDDNRLVGVTEVVRTHCRQALPPANSAAAGQVVPRILDDRDAMIAHVIPLANMVVGTNYLVYKYGTTDWESLTISETYPTGTIPAINQGFRFTGGTTSGTGQVTPISFPASNMVAGGTYSINDAGNTNWVALGAANNTANTEFTYNGVVPGTWGTGQARPRFRGKPASITYHACKLVNGTYSWVEV
jgi:hypothetical protein